MESYYLSPVGVLKIETNEEAVTGIRLVKDRLSAEGGHSSHPLVKEVCRQLDEYFAGKRLKFDLPLAPKGTDFQQTVWKHLQQIPYGTTISYGQLAKSVGNPKACRAVGSANGKNPVAIVIPCHRVIASGGGLGGYAYGLEVKKQLLVLENKAFR
jgi:methylated-DNA-[protein]-cysteine S-methyltransferase